MEDRKWENMITGCLVNIFGRLSMRSRLHDVPLVCKAWFRAICNPLCWQTLDFSQYFEIRRYSLVIAARTDWIKFTIRLSQRCVTTLLPEDNSSREELIFFSEECPALKTLSLSSHVCHNHSDIIPSLIVKWKNLEYLTLEGRYCIKDVLEVISIHLHKFTGLCITNAPVDEEIPSAIVSLPTLKFLTIKESIVFRENLLIILRGCKQLVSLDVRNCIGFDEDYEEILKLSSGIKNFQCDGSYTMESYDYFYYDVVYLPEYDSDYYYDD